MTDTIEHLASRRRVPVVRESRSPVAKAATIAGLEWLETKREALFAGTRQYDVRSFGDLEVDPTAAISDALTNVAAAGGGTVTMPRGSYPMTELLPIPDGVMIDLNGSTLDFSAASVPAGSYLVSTTGALSSLPNLAANVVRWSDSVRFVSAHGLVVGDWFCIYNPMDSSYSQSRPYYREGMWFQVVQVVSTTEVRTRQKVLATLPTSCTVHKMTPSSGSVTNGTIVGKKGVNLYGVVATYTAGTQITNLKVLDCQYAGIMVERSVDFTITDNFVHAPMDSVGAEDHYGIVVGNSQHGLVSGNNALAQSHAFTLGGGTGPGAVPNRWIIVADNIITTTGPKAALDSHGGSEYYAFRGNIVYGAISAGGDNATIESNEINVRTVTSITITSEACGSNFSIINNRITLSSRWSAANGGAINIIFTTSSYTGLPSMTRNNGHLVIRGNVFDCGGFTPSDSTNMGSLVQIFFANTPATGTRIEFSQNRLNTGVSTTSGLTQYQFLLVRTLATTSLRSLDVIGNDFGTAGLYTWNADIQSTRVLDNLFQFSVYSAIYLSTPTGSATYPAPIIDIAGNTIDTTHSNAVWIAGQSAGAKPGICKVRNNTIRNANGRASASAGDGAGVRAQYCKLLMMVDNVWGDDRTTPLQTRRLHIAFVDVLSRANNETVGSITTDTLSSVGVDRAPA